MSQAPPPKLTLEITPPDAASFRRVVEADKTIIGRDSGDIAIGDPESSALHAEIDCSTGHVIVRDLGSRNGTWREGKKLGQFALYEGQSFHCGSTEIRLVTIEGALATPQAGQTAVGEKTAVISASDTLTRGSAQPPPAVAPPADRHHATLIPGSPIAGGFEPPPGWSAPGESSTPTVPGANAKPPPEDTTMVLDAPDENVPPALGSPAPLAAITHTTDLSKFLPPPSSAPTAPGRRPPSPSSTATAPGNDVVASGGTAPPPPRPVTEVDTSVGTTEPDNGNSVESGSAPSAPGPITEVNTSAPAPRKLTQVPVTGRRGDTDLGIGRPASSSVTQPGSATPGRGQRSVTLPGRASLDGEPGDGLATGTTTIPEPQVESKPIATADLPTAVENPSVADIIAAADAEHLAKKKLQQPVANAVIKDPSTLADARKRTGPRPTVRAGRWKRPLAYFAIATTIAAALGGIGYLVMNLLAARELAFGREVAEHLPADTIAVATVASIDATVDLAGDAVPPDLRTQATEVLGLDPFADGAWQEFGIDPGAPIGLAILAIEPPVFALSVGVSDVETFTKSIDTALERTTGSESLTLAPRTFADAKGWSVSEGSLAVAATYVDERAVLIWSPRVGDIDLVEGEAKEVAELSKETSLASRAGFKGLIAAKGKTLAVAYVDGPSLAAALPGTSASVLAARMALADLDGFGAVVSSDDKDVHLTLETVVREGARHLEFGDTKGRSGDALDRISDPALGALDASFNADALDRSLSGLASLAGGSLPLLEQETAEAWGVDLRKDITQNLDGRIGLAVLEPGGEDGTTPRGVGWIGVRDPEVATSVLERIAAKKTGPFGELHAEFIEEVPIYRGEEGPRVFVSANAMWFAFGEVDLRSIIKGPDRAAIDDPRHPAIANAMKKGDLVAGFVDLQVAARVLPKLLHFDEGVLETEAVKSVTDPLEVLSLRTWIKKRTVVSRVTLHTSVEDALPTLIDRALQANSAEMTQRTALAARGARCEALAEHIEAVIRDELETNPAANKEAAKQQRRMLEACPRPQTPSARVQCYLEAPSRAAFDTCDIEYPASTDAADSGAGAEGGGDSGNAPIEPIAVPYAQDIWPHVGDDPDADKPQANVNYGVALGADPPTRGPEDALVTIVEFGDFECPYCKQVMGTLDEVLAEHGKDVRLVFRHHPLERIHDNARLAARAAVAAHAQGKFWALHDAMYENQKNLEEAAIRRMAEGAGLDMTRFDRDFYDAKTDRRVQRDVDEADKFGSTGTPAFFINGRYLGGAQTKSAFAAVIAEEKARALKFVERRGGTRVRLYEDMITHFAPKVLKPSQALPTPAADEERHIVSTAGLARKGASGFARVQLIECGDFDCPFCARVHKTLDKLVDAYPTKVAVFFAHNPLDFHPGAEPAARAAVAAGKQGKFWEMHDQLFEGQDGTARTKADYLSLAKKLRLDADEFEKDFDDTTTAQTVADQKKLCGDNGAEATPTFFVNGRRVTGALELREFKTLIDEELAAGI